MKYELDGENLLTPCPYKPNEMVGSYWCELNCPHFISIDEDNQEVECECDEEC